MRVQLFPLLWTLKIYKSNLDGKREGADYLIISPTIPPAVLRSIYPTNVNSSGLTCLHDQHLHSYIRKRNSRTIRVLPGHH